MTSLFPIILAAATTPLAQGAPVTVPSGMAVSFHDMIRDDTGQGPVFRLRFVAPALAGESPDFDHLATDMDSLCAQLAVSATDDSESQPTRIVISLMESPVTFGELAPQVTQVFEAYSLEKGRCIWEAF
ncbi:acetolactate synthase [Citreicella sp. C3M06]|uniref:DUF6497 family protein n=1 Tax=Citreicella sp. C3M06 TaxID=2841564 RepID=UPI001C094D42|nr:DUF6497 family protein [Citreicella sp. C3M06]MBU2962704.1 acetolactate synthase [Citreicella sp. C3M06]